MFHLSKFIWQEYNKVLTFGAATWGTASNLQQEKKSFLRKWLSMQAAAAAAAATVTLFSADTGL